MKKEIIGLIIPNDIEKAPYVQYYIDILKKNNINYEIIEWCRGKCNSKNIAYYSNIQSENKFVKLYLYLRFINFCRKKIIFKKYDKLIIFTAQLGILLEAFLVKYYTDKYIIDIRDYNNLISYAQKAFNKLLKNSYCNVISSYGFKEWLPSNYKYIICHNINREFLSFKNVKNIKNKFPKKILTIGMIRDLKKQEKFIEQFYNDYILEYRGIGRDIEKLKEKYGKLKNVKFYGKYKKEDEINFYLESDFVNLIVGDDINSRTLLANRFYNALITNKYMIASKNSYMGKIVEKYQLGIALNDINFFNIDVSNLEYNKNMLIEKIEDEQSKFELKVCNFLL